MASPYDPNPQLRRFWRRQGTRSGGAVSAAPTPAGRKLARRRGVVRLRRSLALALLLIAGGVLAAYWLNRRAASASNAKARLAIPTLGIKIQQSAHGVTVYKSVGGRPIFRISAQRAEKLRGNGQDTLYDVRVLGYDSAGLAADEISGNAFAYDQATGELRARGTVRIRFQRKPGGQVLQGGGLQVEANDLTYNVRTGAGAMGSVRFRFQNAQGQAGQGRIASHSGLLTLTGGVRVTWQRARQVDMVLTGDQARLRRLEGGAALPSVGRGASSGNGAMRLTVQGHALLRTGDQRLSAGQLVFGLGRDQSLRTLDASQGVRAGEQAPGRSLEASAGVGHARFGRDGADGAMLEGLTLGGNVVLTQATPGQQERLTAQSVDFSFLPGHQLSRMVARQRAQLSLQSAHGTGVPDTVAAPELVFQFAPGAGSATAQLTAVRASGGATAEFAGRGSGPVRAQAASFRLVLDARQQPLRARASGNVRVRQTVAGGVRIGRSDRLELLFTTRPGASAQIERVIADGQVRLQGEGRTVLADHLDDDLATRRVVLTAQPGSAFSHGQVRGSGEGASFAAPMVVWTSSSHGAGQLAASGGVALNRAATSLMGSTLPVTVSAARLLWTQPAGAVAPLAAAPGTTAFPGTAVFTGAVRLFQAPNLLRADRLVVDGAAGTVAAYGHVQGAFVQATPLAGLGGAAHHRAQPVYISADRLRYNQGTGHARFDGDVVLASADARLTAPTMNVALEPAGKTGAAALKTAVASGGVHITQPGRTAQARQATFDFERRRGVLEGGPPSIFDAEQGRISGDPLTFSWTSDEIQVGSIAGARAAGETTLRK